MKKDDIIARGNVDDNNNSEVCVGLSLLQGVLSEDNKFYSEAVRMFISTISITFLADK